MPQKELTFQEKKYATQKIKIMDIFSEKLKEKPLVDITIKEIAKELEISEMTFFNYFKNKREVLVYFIEFWNLEMQFKLEQAENLDARASIYLVFEETAKLIEHNYQLFVEIVSNIVLNGIPKKNITIGRAERLMRFWVDTKHKEGGLKELLMPLVQELNIDKEEEFFIYTALHNTLFFTPLLMSFPEFKTLKEHYFEQIDYILEKDAKETSMYETAYCKVEYLKEKNAIFCEWKQFCKGNDYRNPLRYGAELIEKHKPSTWITDTTNGFESEEADAKWLLEEFMPKMIESSIKKVIFIIKNDSPLMEEIMGQKEALGEFFEVVLVESLEKR